MGGTPRQCKADARGRTDAGFTGAGLHCAPVTSNLQKMRRVLLVGLGGVMGRMGGVLMRVAAVLALLALVLAPVADAATHGPAAVKAQAEHAVLHVGPGDHLDHHGHHHGHSHGHHDATDHDHSASVILPAGPVLALPQGTAQGVAVAQDFAGTAAEGLRRPPRA